MVGGVIIFTTVLFTSFLLISSKTIIKIIKKPKLLINNDNF